jgi:hypothetical protein
MLRWLEVNMLHFWIDIFGSFKSYHMFQVGWVKNYDLIQ